MATGPTTDAGIYAYSATIATTLWWATLVDVR